MKLLTCLVLALLIAVSTAAQEPRKQSAKAACALIPANPAKFDWFAYMPKTLPAKANRFPKVSYKVGEDGHTRDIKVLKSTGYASIDAGLVKSIQQWRYQPQPGCEFESLIVGVTIDIR